MDVPSHAGQPQDALLRRLYEARVSLPLSFEVFPPKEETGHAALQETVDRLSPMAGHGFSVTMGRGGATRALTIETATGIAARTGRPVMAHLISLGMTHDAVLETADELWQTGIRHILALRGDRPDWPATVPPGFAHASELVGALAAVIGLSKAASRATPGTTASISARCS